jgi:hypothetical protein
MAACNGARSGERQASSNFRRAGIRGISRPVPSGAYSAAASASIARACREEIHPASCAIASILPNILGNDSLEEIAGSLAALVADLGRGVAQGSRE